MTARRSPSSEAFIERLRRLHEELGEPVAVGVSSVCQGEAAFADGFAEAQQRSSVRRCSRKAAVLAYDELGAYKYLLRVALDGGVRDATIDAVGKLAEYDAQRGAQLLATLEEFLRRHGSISATSEALFVHPNTLRQRLRRIGELSGIDLRRDDWLDDRDRGEDGAAPARHGDGETAHIAAWKVWRPAPSRRCGPAW